MKSKFLIISVITTLAVFFTYIGFSCFGRYKLVGTRFLNSQFDKTADYFNTTNIGEYEEVYFQLYHQNMLIFASDATTLVATYSDTEYAKQVEKLQQEITFLEKSQYGVHGDFDINNWHFEMHTCRPCTLIGSKTFHYIRISLWNNANTTYYNNHQNKHQKS